MLDTKRRILAAYSHIADENLRDLIAQLVQINVENASSGQIPRSKYKAVIEAFADKYGSQLDPTLLDKPAIPIHKFSSSKSQDTPTGFITFDSLTLTNFGSYREPTTIELSPKGSQNVTAVIGSNGDGKSTLFYALNWALYGDDYLADLEREKERSLESLINRAALKAAIETDSTLKVSVRLSFRVRGSEYYVEREATAEKSQAGEMAIRSRRTYFTRIDASGNHADLLPDALSSVLSIMPKSVRDFYLFDGEQINRFVSRGSHQHIRRAIRRVMGIEALENTANALSTVSGDLMREVRRHTKGEQATEISAKLERALKERTEARELITEKENEVIAVRQAIERLDDLLENTPDTQHLQRHRNQLETQLQNFKADHERLAFDIRDVANTSALFLAGDAVESLTTYLDQQREKGIIPGTISEQLLVDLLELGSCICEADASEGTKTRENLVRTLDELRAKEDVSQTALNLFYELAPISRTLIEKAQDLDRKRAEQARLFERRRTIEEELTEINDELANMEIVNRTGWERERTAYRSQETNIQIEISTLKRRIDDLTEAISKLKQEEERVVKQSDIARRLTIQRNWAEAAEEGLRFVYGEFSRTAIEEIECSTSDLWKLMLPNIGNYRVTVSDDFELEVLDPANRPAMQDLSMGQQQCLGLAFIMAIARVAEVRPPLVIDMPFGRLGADVASSVAKTLPSLTEQLILFVLPETEWHDQTKEALDPFMRRTYSIKYYEEMQTTKVFEGEGGYA